MYSPWLGSSKEVQGPNLAEQRMLLWPVATPSEHNPHQHAPSRMEPVHGAHENPYLATSQGSKNNLKRVSSKNNIKKAFKSSLGDENIL